MQKLTQRQKMVLEFIQSTIDTDGYPPTLREIGNFMGIRSTNGVNDHLRALERKGFLKREDMKSRALRPVRPPSMTDSGLPGKTADLLEIPILGQVAAGALAEAIDAPEDSVHIDRMLVGGRAGDIYGIRVRAESMIDAGIHDGDYVFVRKQLEASRGDIVIAMVGGEATCKFYFPEKEHVRLQPANSQMAPILVHRNDWRSTQILGVVVGLYRRLN
jgi:repressor LexA